VFDHQLRKVQEDGKLDEIVTKLSSEDRFNATVIFDKVDTAYFIGGYTDQNCFEATNSCYKFSLSTKEAEILQPLTYKRAQVGALFLKEKNSILVAGGAISDEVCSKTCEIYNISENNWQMMPSLNEQKANVSLLQLGEGKKIYCFGGHQWDKFFDTIETISNESTDQEWKILAIKLPTPSHSIGAIELSNNHILIFGGRTQDGLSSYATILTIDQDSSHYFSATGNL